MEEENYDWWYWHSVRLSILERDKCCGYCGVKLDQFTVTIDHMIPTSRGGSKHSKDNMVAACKKCNAEKDDMLPLEYLCYRQRKPIDFMIKKGHRLP